MARTRLHGTISGFAGTTAHLIDAMGGGLCKTHGGYYGHGKHGLRDCPYCDIEEYYKKSQTKGKGNFEPKDPSCIGRDSEPKAPEHHRAAVMAKARDANNTPMVRPSHMQSEGEFLKYHSMGHKHLKGMHYRGAEEYADSQINAYHQSQSNEPFTKFKQKGDKGYKKAHYSQASEGIYFSPKKELVRNKYGKGGGLLIAVHLNMKYPLDLGQYDAMYFDGRKVLYGELVVENFKREMRGEKPLPETDIILTGISQKAKKWLIEHGYDSVQGMKGEMWSAPEYVVLSASQIKTREQLIEEFNRARGYG